VVTRVVLYSVLQCVAVCCSVMQFDFSNLGWVGVCALQRVAVSCGTLLCDAVFGDAMQCVAGIGGGSWARCAGVRVLQCVALCIHHDASIRVITHFCVA